MTGIRIVNEMHAFSMNYPPSDKDRHQTSYMNKSSSRKYLRTKVTPDFHLTYSKNGENLGSESK